MAFVIKDRVKEGSTFTGTGDITLSGAAATFDPFSSHMTDGDTTYYVIAHTATGVDEWEVGLGTWNTGNTITRTTIIDGSSGTSAVDFSAGNKDVFMTYSATMAAYTDGSGDLSSAIGLGNHTTTDVAEGSNLYFTTGRIDSHLSGGTGVTYNAGAISVGQAVATTSNVTFNTVTLSGNPGTALQAATKEYVDTIAAAGIHYHERVRVEAATNRPATYDNGTSGVGATLTNSGTQEVLVIDGVTVDVADRVLITKQTNTAHNGVYTVTNVGSASTNWVLTRATDADSYGASDKDALGEGDAYFVKEGLTGAGELYVMNTPGVITFGTTPITFTVIAETAIYTAGTGLTLTGTEFATVQDIATGASPTFVTVNANLLGNVTGNVTGNVSGSSGSTTGNAATATKLATARTVQLSGDVTGSASFDGSANINITATVGDDSHAHVISNVDGLQAALDAKADDSTTITAGTGLTGGGTLGVNSTLSLDTTYTDTRYVNATGDTMTGALTATGFTGPLTGNATTATTTTGNAGSATVLQTARTINGVSFNGSANITVADATKLPLTGGAITGAITSTSTFDGRDVSVDGAKLDGIAAGATNVANTNQLTNGAGYITSSGSISGNADTATQATRVLVTNSDAFSNYNMLWHSGNDIYSTNGIYCNPGNDTIIASNFSGPLSGNATTATTLQTARNINGVSFNGSADITVADSSKVPTSGLVSATNAEFKFNSNQNTGTGSNPPLQAYSSSGGAIMAFHRASVYAVNMGLDSDNVFRIGGWSAAANRLQMDMSGNLTMAGNVTAYSDVRLKSNIQTIESGLDKVCAMRGVTFEKDGVAGLGVIAQEMEAIIPEVVMTQNDGMKSVAYGNIVGVLIEAIKELKLEIETLKAKL